MDGTKPAVFDRLCSAEINGVHTNFVFQQFQNKIFLLITQNRKIGNVFTVRFEAENLEDYPFGETPAVTPPLNIIHFFGEDTDEIRSAVQFIICNSKLKRSTKEVMISLGLNEINGKCLKEIVEFLENLV